MNFEVYPTADFQRAFKSLAKRHRSLTTDMNEFVKSLKENPYQGTELTPGIRKIRMAITSKGKGKSGGARVITYTIQPDELDGRIYLLDIYDKSDFNSVDLNVIKEIVSELGL